MSSESDAQDEDLTRTADGQATPDERDMEARQPAEGPGTLIDGGLGQWGHLRLLRKIGEGAYGEVYHAHDLWLDHPVALKILKPHAANRDVSTRILQEARKLARVRHPNVVSIHGADSHNGQVGFWMDLVEGNTLAEHVAEGRLSAGEATHIGQEICRALSAVHQAKLVHRDVKAQNVMRASDGGRIILMDFGAGEFMGGQPARARGQGTPVYLAPEVLAGGHASVRSDIYAVGVLLYHLVTGEYPVRGSSVPALIDAHAHGRRRRLRDVRSDLPDSFVAIVERALEADPGRRYESAGELLAALSGEATTGDLLQTATGHSSDTPTERTTLQLAGRVALILAGTLFGTAVLGLIASRVFEVALQIDPDFRAGPADYFVTGAYALVPFVLCWVAGAAVLGLFVGLRPFVRSRITSRWARRIGWSPDPVLAAATVFLVGAGCLVALTWAFLDVFSAIDQLFTDPSSTSIDVSILGPDARDAHRAHAAYSVGLSFLLGLAAWRWLPRVETRVEDASTIRTLKWATLAVAFLVVALAVAPRRIIWDRFEVVEFENRQALVIGTSEEELLLYAPSPAPGTRWRVRPDAPALRRTDVRRQLFDRQQ